MNNNHQTSQNNFFTTTNNNNNKINQNNFLYNSNNLSSNNFMLEQKRSRFMSTDDITSDIEMKPIQSSHPRFFQYIPTSSSSTFSKKMSIDLTDDNFNKNIQIIGCNCKNSGCLKRYCECFTRMKFCDANCQCKNCFNTIEHEKERNESIQIYLMKSPISFKKNNLNINNVTCSCKKSNCLKKYCECYQIGIKCNNNCKCFECKNRNKGDKKMFEVNNIENNNNNKKRDRYFSFDEISFFNRNEKDGLFYNNFNNNNNQIISLKTVEIDTKKVIIDNYNFLNNNNNNINNNINIVNDNNTILNNNENNNRTSAFNTMKVNDN